MNLHDQSSSSEKSSTFDYISRAMKIYSPLIDAIYSTRIEGIKSFKNSSKSIKYRTEGNEAFNKKEYMKAVIFYNDSIFHAPINSPELAISIANRSAVLRKMGKLSECLVDLQRVLDSGYYPENLKYKLFLRQAQCRRDLMEQSKDFFRLAINAVYNSNLSPNDKQKWISHIEKEQKMKVNNPVQKTHEVITPTQIPVLSYGTNEEIPCASSALELCYNKFFGRHFVATRDIKIGDVLIVETPFAVAPPANEITFHSCSHCQKICFNLLPCPDCTWAMFCSEQCLTEAAEQYHLVECPVVSKFILLNGNIHDNVVLTIRIIAKVGLQNLQKYFDMPVVEDTKEAKRTRGFNVDGKYDSSDFLTILNLENNISKLDQEAIYIGCGFTLKICKCFPSYMNSDQFSFFIFQLLLSCSCNSISIRYPILKSGSSDVIRQTIGGAIYPVLSLLSHSCNPSALPMYYGNQLVLQALQPISKGKQVTVSYVIPWAENDKISRQTQLKNKYKFDCNCIACRENWPSLHDLKPFSTSYLIKHFPSNFVQKLSKLNCSYVFCMVESMLKDRNLLMKFMNERIKNLSEVISVFHDLNQMNNHDFYCFKHELVFLYFSCGTAMTNMI